MSLSDGNPAKEDLIGLGVLHAAIPPRSQDARLLLPATTEAAMIGKWDVAPRRSLRRGEAGAMTSIKDSWEESPHPARLLQTLAYLGYKFSS